MTTKLTDSTTTTPVMTGDPDMKISPMDDQAKMTAMVALLHIIEAERILRPLATQFETEHPELFDHHVEGVRKELNNKSWSARADRRTLGPLLKVLMPHKGLNESLALLPYYATEYQRVVDFRNAIGHGDWEEVVSLGGSEGALEWAKSFRHLVALSIDDGGSDPMAGLRTMAFRAMLQMTPNKWPWPST